MGESGKGNAERGMGSGTGTPLATYMNWFACAGMTGTSGTKPQVSPPDGAEC